VDLQLAYLAAPASAAAASVVQQGPAAAAQAAQAAFASQLEQREETIEETPRAQGARIEPDGEGGNGSGYSPRERRRSYHARTDETLVPADDGEKHFIDTTA
jgi:hypothetical protein